MSKPNRPTFRLTLTPTPRHDDADGMRRLRGALKTLLRGWSLRCTRIEYLHLENPPSDEASDEGQT